MSEYVRIGGLMVGGGGERVRERKCEWKVEEWSLGWGKEKRRGRERERERERESTYSCPVDVDINCI